MSIKTKATISIEDDYGGRVRLVIDHSHTHVYIYADEHEIKDLRKIIRTEDLVKEKSE